jgi:hypothetical protein
MSDQLWKNIKASLSDSDGVKPWDLLNPNEGKTDKETHKERYSLCLTCPELIQATKTCKQCGCFMKAKTKLQRATCPLGKW